VAAGCNALFCTSHGCETSIGGPRSLLKLACQLLLAGDWVGDMMEGQGTYYYANGDIYSGMSFELTHC
jgi:hypothetical protein